MQKLKDLRKRTYNPKYSEPDFIVVINDHVEVLKKDRSTRTIDLDGAASLKYRGDFFGLLTEHKVKPSYFIANMLINGLTDPGNWDGESLSFLVVSERKIDALLTSHNSGIR